MSCCIHCISHFFLKKKNLVNNMCCSERFFSILFQGHLRTEYSHLVTESEEKFHMAHACRKRKNTERRLLPSIFLPSLRSSPQHQEHQISFGAYFEPSIMVVICLYYLTPTPCPQSIFIKLVLSSTS